MADTTDISTITSPSTPASATAKTEDIDIDTWKTLVQIQQQKYYVLLGNRQWDSIPVVKPAKIDKNNSATNASTNDELKAELTLNLSAEFLSILERKIAFGLYGLPSRIPDENKDPTVTVPSSVKAKTKTQDTNNVDTTSDIDIGYTDDQMTLVNKISKLIHWHSSSPQQTRESIWFSCIFICGKYTSTDTGPTFTTPLFKFMKKDPKNSTAESVAHKEMFIDMDCRIYDGFSNWLTHNKLPPCHVCYPTGGRYIAGPNGSVDVAFGFSPSSSISTRFISFLDMASLVTSLGSATVGIATLATFPISAPVISVASIAGLVCGGYAVAKAGTTIVDRAVHQQPIGLDDPASRMLWLHLVGGTLGAVHLRLVDAMSNAAHAGHLITKAEEIGFLLVHVGEITSSGLEIIKSAVELSQKYERDELNPLDLYHFMASCLFFGHDLVTFETAGQIIKQVQTDLTEKEKEVEAEIEAEPNKKSNKKGSNTDAEELGLQVLQQALTSGQEELLGQRAAELQGKKETHVNSCGVVKELNHIQNAKQFYSNLTEKANPWDAESTRNSLDDDDTDGLGSFVFI